MRRPDSLSNRRAARFAPLLMACLAGCGAPAEPRAPVRETVVKLTPKVVVEAPPPRLPDVGPHGEKAAIVGNRLEITPVSGAKVTVDPAEIHPPPGDRARRGIVPTALLFLDDGTLLVGASDGTVSALDSAYRRRRSVGLRGPISGFAVRQEKPG